HDALCRGSGDLLAGHEDRVMEREGLAAQPRDSRSNLDVAGKMQLIEIVDDEARDHKLETRPTKALQERIDEVDPRLLEKGCHGCVVDVADVILITIADGDGRPVVIEHARAGWRRSGFIWHVSLRSAS